MPCPLLLRLVAGRCGRRCARHLLPPPGGELPVVGLLQVENAGRRLRRPSGHEGRPCQRDVHVVRLVPVRHQAQAAGQHRARACHHDRRLEHAPQLEPVGGGQAGRGGQPHGCLAAVEEHVKPAGQAVDGAGAGRCHLQLQRQLDVVQRGLGAGAKVKHLGRAGGGEHGVVKRVHHHLPKVAVHRGGVQRGDVHPVKVVLGPEHRLGRHLCVQHLVAERGRMDAAQLREHLAARLEERVARVQVRLQHALVDQQRAHGLRHQHVYLLTQRDLLNLGVDDLDA
mmetsp:Transcript_3043/g.7592  ORF Transcript_3043/g.7592 Transcript_3043/m.7592 type:complete len:282 (+) Transcript_3043:652-1497(+)